MRGSTALLGTPDVHGTLLVSAVNVRLGRDENKVESLSASRVAEDVQFEQRRWSFDNNVSFTSVHHIISGKSRA